MMARLFLYFAAAILLFCALQFFLSKLAKLRGNKEAESLAAAASGLAAAAFFLTLSCRTMLQSGIEIAIIALNLVLVLTGCAFSAMPVAQSMNAHTAAKHGPAGRYATILAILGAYVVISTLTILSFAHSERMTALLKLGLFLVTRFTFLFPLGVAVLAFVKMPGQEKM